MNEDNTPLVSVVVTTYGRFDTLERALKSVRDQTYKNIEILVIDDNADVEVAKRIEAIAVSVHDDRIRVIHNEKNLGGSLARNVGIANSRGEYIAFLDDDDIYLPEKVEKQLRVMLADDSDKLALVYCWDTMVDKDGKTFAEHTGNNVGNCIFAGMYDCIAATTLWMCKKAALNSVGNFTDTPCKQDSYVIVKLLLAGYTVDRVPEYLAVYDTGAAVRISTKKSELRIIGEEKLRTLCRSNYDKITKPQQKEVEYAFATRLAEHYLALGKLGTFLKYIMMVFLKHPIKRESLRCCKRCLKVMLKK